jgi:hypothetical protein
MSELLIVCMRWMHISSMAALAGGMLYGRAVAGPTVSELDREAARFRPWVLAAIAGLVLSGLYNIVSTPGHTARYRVVLAVKLLLALHVFAAALAATRAGHPRRSRLMLSAAVSGFAIMLISAYLRSIF